jgi:hypothetical protein
MEPVSPTRAVSMRTLLLSCLGVLALVSVAVAIVVSHSSLSRPNRAGARGGADNGLGGASASATAVAADATDGTGTGGGTGDSGNTGGQTATPTWTPTHTAQTGPQVVYFRFKQQPRCISPGNNLPAIVEWKVSGATGAALSVDNPGIVGSYRSYDGTTGSETLYAGCGGSPGSTEKHTYTIYTVGGSPQRSATLTATLTVPAPTPTPSRTS